MKKVLFLNILALSLLASCFQPVFADEWPSQDNVSEVNVQVEHSSPFADAPIFNEGVTPDSGPVTNHEGMTPDSGPVTNHEGEISATDKGAQDITDKRAPVFDESAFQVGEIDYTDVSQLLPDVNIDDAVEWGQRKTYEIIQLLQTFVQPICIISFIISAFMFLFGTIAHNNWAGRGLMGIIMSSVVYALVMFAPVIVQTFTAWVSS